MLKHILSVITAFGILLPEVIFAQDMQTGSTADDSPRSAQQSESTESLNNGRGGFLGIGGQKPMNRVNGIPLPTRGTRMAANSQGVGYQPSVSDSYPVAVGRRTKSPLGDLTTDFPARMIYLNGKNISSVRDQQLDGVSVRIDANGNLHISAPQYEVQESMHYRPLLPNDIPKVGKPRVGTDAPLMQGRYSKPSPTKTNEASAGAVPPIEAEDAESPADDTLPAAKQGVQGQRPATEPAKSSAVAP
ncbi:MAG: hypothetical protein RLZZ488_2858 [Pseudomonadota bacterium]|jgi:hypothetical protein